MFRFLLIAAPTFIVGALFGAFMWWAFSPLLFDTVVMDDVEIAATDQTLATGQFAGKDATHQGSGDARLIQAADGTLELHFTNFNVTNGPDLKVYLSDNADPKTVSDILDSAWVNISHLKGNVGDQVYRLPSDVTADSIKSVAIWCEAFSVLFATATLS